jgi:plasmid stability protein
MKRPTYPSDLKDKFLLRLPDGLRHIVKDRAERNHRSMNSEIVFALQQYLAGESTVTEPSRQANGSVTAQNQPPSRAAASTQG